MSGPDLDNNPLIRELDARRKAAEEARAAEPRVIGLHTRAAWTPEPEPEVEPPAEPAAGPAVDQKSIEMVETLLERLRAGEVRDVLVLATIVETGAFEMLLQLTGKVEVDALRYVGGLELFKRDLLDIADFGLPENTTLIEAADAADAMIENLDPEDEE